MLRIYHMIKHWQRYTIAFMLGLLLGFSVDAIATGISISCNDASSNVDGSGISPQIALWNTDGGLWGDIDITYDKNVGGVILGHIGGPPGQLRVTPWPDGGQETNIGNLTGSAVTTWGNITAINGSIQARDQTGSIEGSAVGCTGVGCYFFIEDANDRFIEARDGGFYFSAPIFVDGTATNGINTDAWIKEYPPAGVVALIDLKDDTLSTVRSLDTSSNVDSQLLTLNAGAEQKGLVFLDSNGVGSGAGTNPPFVLRSSPNGATNTTVGWIVDKAYKTWIGAPGSINVTAGSGWSIPTQLYVSGTSRTTTQMQVGTSGATYFSSDNTTITATGALTGSSTITATTSVTATTSMSAAGGLTTINGTSGKMTFDSTDSSGTPGNANINKPSGRVAVAAVGTGVVITNSLITTATHPFVTMTTADATCTFVKSAVPTANTLTITVNAACTGTTTIDFFIIN